MKTNWRRFYSIILTAVVLALGYASPFYPNQAQAGTPDDVYTIERYHTENSGIQSTASTTYQDALTLTFTPPTTKSYLVMVSSWTNNSNNLYATFARFTIDGTTYSEVANKPVDTSLNNQGFSTHKVISLDATVHTVKIQYRTENASGNAIIEHPVISIIEVANYYNAEANAENTTTSTSYVDAVSLTFTPPGAGGLPHPGNRRYCQRYCWKECLRPVDTGRYA